MTWLSTAHLSVISITPMCILHDVFTTVGDYSLSILLFEIHHRGWFSLFSIHFVKQQKVAKASFHTVHRVVRKKLNFGLRVCRICSCVMIIKIKMLCITEIHCLPQGTPFFNPHIYILLSLTLLKYNQKWLEWNYTVVIGYICCFPKNQNILKSILTVFGWIQNLPHLSFNFMN